MRRMSNGQGGNHSPGTMPQLCLNASNTPARDKIHHGEQVTSDNPAVQGRRLGGREPSGGSEIRGEGTPGGGEKASREEAEERQQAEIREENTRRTRSRPLVLHRALVRAPPPRRDGRSGGGAFRGGSRRLTCYLLLLLPLTTLLLWSFSLFVLSTPLLSLYIIITVAILTVL